LSQEQKEVLVCREMGWSHHDYLEAPWRMIRSIFSMLNEEAEESNRRNKAD
jgi:hypothetical protein